MKQNLALLFSAAILLQACAGPGKLRFVTSVDAIASPTAASKKEYVLLPGKDGVTWDDLQFREYAAYLIRVLTAKGYHLAESADDAEVAIVLSYGIGDPQQELYSYTLPVYGQTGVASAQTYGTASSYGGTTTYSGTTTYTPSYGVTGYSSHTGTRTTYFRYLLITGYDFQEYLKSERQVQIWRTTVTSTGSSGDLRYVFPILVAAAVPYVGGNSGKQVPVTLHEDDEIVRAVKGNIDEPAP